MRKLSPSSKDKVRQRLGLEPMLVVGVKWNGPAGHETRYGDKARKGDFEARVLEIAGIDDVQKVAGAGSSGGVSVKLDDTDGTLRAIMTRVDIHKKPVVVYQGFEGIPELFPVFEGVINTPITWSEAERTLSFAVVTIIEDWEVGFSAEEGMFPNLPDDAIGKPWPMCFGSPDHVPGLTFQVVPVGQIMTNIIVEDRTLGLVQQFAMSKLEAVNDNLATVLFYQAMAHFAGDYEAEDGFKQQSIEIQEEANRVRHANLEKIAAWQREMYAYQVAVQNEMSQLVGPATRGYTILANNAKWFPQDTPFYAKCGEFLLHGSVHGDRFTFDIIQPPLPQLRPWTTTDDNGQKTSGVGWVVPSFGEGDLYVDENNVVQPVFKGTMGRGPHGESIPPGYQYVDSIQPEGVRIIPAGTPIQIVSDVTIDYIFSITPTKRVRNVWAWKNVGNVRQLCLVPAHRWTYKTTGYGTVTAHVIELKRPLSGYAYEAWEDQVYVDVDSGVGPDVGDVMAWMIANYTTHGLDPDEWKPGTSPQSPCHFVMQKRGNVLAVLAEIATLSRNVVWLRDGKFCCRYLAEEGEPVDVIAEDDVEVGTMEIFSTETEEVMTRIKADYTSDYALQDKSKVIVKANVDFYGLRTEEQDYYIYTDSEAVAKSAVFWLIRKSNTWKKIKFKTFLHHLGLETYDTVLLDFETNWVADGAIKGIVESCVYDSVDNTLAVTVWLPVVLGEMTQHPLAWPAGVDPQVWHPYIPKGVSPQPKPPFYAGQINGMFPVVVGGGTKVQYNWPKDEKAKKDSKTTDGDTSPSDQDDEKPRRPDPPPPPPPQQQSVKMRFNYDDIFDDGTTPTESKLTPSSSLPGEVVSKGEDVNYVVDIFPYGVAEDPVRIKNVRQLQIADGAEIPAKTWVLVSKLRDKKSNVHYYMQVPVWLD